MYSIPCVDTENEAKGFHDRLHHIVKLVFKLKESQEGLMAEELPWDLVETSWFPCSTLRLPTGIWGMF